MEQTAFEHFNSNRQNYSIYAIELDHTDASDERLKELRTMSIKYAVTDCGSKPLPSYVFYDQLNKMHRVVFGSISMLDDNPNNILLLFAYGNTIVFRSDLINKF